MICQRCLRNLPSNECQRCKCASKHHMNSVSECPKNVAESGDRLFTWKCAVCHKTTSKSNLNTINSTESLIDAINIITEKFEVVNKIQLPKLNNDLMQVKSITEHIMKQNTDILRKMGDLDVKIKKAGGRPGCSSSSSPGYRTRNVDLLSKVKDKKFGENDHVPILPLNEKYAARYRKRRLCVLYRMLHLLNRNRNARSKTPRRKI